MEGYHVEIQESTKDLTARERILMKDISNAIKLDEATENGQVVEIAPKGYAILNVHNEKADQKEYKKYIIWDNEQRYVTGSESFWSTFVDIFADMKDEEEEYTIAVFKKDSQNYKGKQFLTCSIE